MKEQSLSAQMTLEEKCSLLSGGTQFTTKSLERLHIEPIFLADGPHGVRKQAGSTDHLGLNPSIRATCYPVAASVANSWDLSLAERIGEHLGLEAKSQGVSILLGPGLNIKRNPLCGRNFEYFSEDPYLSGKMAGAYVRGIQKNGIAACPKHFAVNSQETFRMASDSILDERTLREIYLTGFEITVKEGKPKAIMTSYNLVNGVYANDSEKLLNDILIKEWGFDGFVVTDWGGSNDRVQGLIAGNHLEMPATRGNSDREILRAVKEGRISEELVNKRVEELLSVLKDISLANESYHFDEKEHHDFAREAEEQSIVLLKNEGNLLPLASGTKTAIIGDFAETPRYQGAGSSRVNCTRIDTPREELEKSSLTCIGYEQGFLRDGSASVELKQNAVSLAKKADVVLLFMGLDETGEAEGMDRRDMSIHQNQVELLQALAKVNPNIAVILAAGSVVDMSWDSEAKALVYGCLGGQAQASAIARVLTGEVNPSGKLAETYPVSYDQLPGAQNYPSWGKTSEYREGIYVGYRYFEKAGKQVKYPFGFGLSYTRFSYGEMSVTKDGASFTITNEGAVPGAEAAQLYVSTQGTEIFSPVKELKGFCKVYLEPRESRRMTIPLDERAFRYYNVETDQFEILGGTYEILIGASSADIRLTETLTVEGTTKELPYVKDKLPSYWSGNVCKVPYEEFEALLGHKIPDSGWDRKAPISPNQPIASLEYAKNPLARLVYKIINHKRLKAEKKGKPDLNILFIYNMPFRGIAKMMGGAVDIAMVDAMLVIVNGHFFRGLGRLLKAYRDMKKEQKEGIT